MDAISVVEDGSYPQVVLVGLPCPARENVTYQSCFGAWLSVSEAARCRSNLLRVFFSLLSSSYSLVVHSHRFSHVNGRMTPFSVIGPAARAAARQDL
jgi:hypothetical protein